MSKTILKWLVVAGLGFLLLPAVAAAQESSKQEVKVTSKGAERESSKMEVTIAPISVYRLDYVIHELDNGKQINQRKYSLSAEATHGPGKDWARVRVGRRVPVPVAAKPGGEPLNFQYMDVGMSLDCALREDDGGLVLETSVEMSSVVTGGELAAQGAPVTRQARANMVSLLTPGKPTIIGTLDDVDSTRSYQIEVTATRMK
jgi:hypothetical protein